MKTDHNGLYIGLNKKLIAFLIGTSVVSGLGAAVVIHHLPHYVRASHVPYDPDFERFMARHGTHSSDRRNAY